MEILTLLFALVVGAGAGRFANIMLGRQDDNFIENAILGGVGIVIYALGVWCLSLFAIEMPDVFLLHLGSASVCAFLAVVIAEFIRGH